MVFLYLVSCFYRIPVPIVIADTSNIDAVYIPAGYSDFIVAAPFDQEVF